MMKFNCYFREAPGGVVVVYIEGYIDQSTFEEIRNLMDRLITFEGKKRIVINIKNLFYMSAAGAGMIYSLATELREGGGQLRLCQASDGIKRLFKFLRIDNLAFNESEEEAILSFETEKGGDGFEGLC